MKKRAKTFLMAQGYFPLPFIHIYTHYTPMENAFLNSIPSVWRPRCCNEEKQSVRKCHLYMYKTAATFLVLIKTQMTLNLQWLRNLHRHRSKITFSWRLGPILRWEGGNKRSPNKVNETHNCITSSKYRVMHCSYVKGQDDRAVNKKQMKCLSSPRESVIA